MLLGLSLCDARSREKKGVMEVWDCESGQGASGAAQRSRRNGSAGVLSSLEIISVITRLLETICGRPVDLVPRKAGRRRQKFVEKYELIPSSSGSTAQTACERRDWTD